MSPTGDEARASDRPASAPDGEPWDDAAWVEVGPDNRWHPTFEERSRSALALAVLVGALLLVAAFASLDDGGGDDDQQVAATSTTATTEPATTTTEALHPASLDGAAAPEECAFDDRGASPLRDRSDATVLVLNGTPRGGHAGETTDSLQELGYTSMSPDNASIRPTSSIEYLPGNCAEAVRLMDDLGIETTTVGLLDTTDDDVFLGRAVLLLTLGRDSL